MGERLSINNITAFNILTWTLKGIEISSRANAARIRKLGYENNHRFDAAWLPVRVKGTFLSGDDCTNKMFKYDFFMAYRDGSCWGRPYQNDSHRFPSQSSALYTLFLATRYFVHWIPREWQEWGKKSWKWSGAESFQIIFYYLRCKRPAYKKLLPVLRKQEWGNALPVLERCCDIPTFERLQSLACFMIERRVTNLEWCSAGMGRTSCQKVVNEIQLIY